MMNFFGASADISKTTQLCFQIKRNRKQFVGTRWLTRDVQPAKTYGEANERLC